MILQYFIQSFVTKLVAISQDLKAGYSELISAHTQSTGIHNGQIFAVIAEDILRATGAHTDRSIVVEPAKTLYHL